MTPNERLRIARSRKYAQPGEAADALGIPRGTYYGHENGHRGFPAGRAPQYAKAFGVSEEWLLYGKGEQPVADTAPLLLPVALPSADALSAMFEAMLEGAAELSPAETARRLAQDLPNGLRQALGHQSGPAEDAAKSRAAKPQSRANDRPAAR